MRFKYKYEDLDCGLCADIKNAGCPYLLCPHIMDNLDDLRQDAEFNAAVEDAESCGTFHRFTLYFLKWIDDGMPQNSATNRRKKPQFDNLYNFKPECKGCPYPSHGFICHDERDGSCLKTGIDRALCKGKSHAGR